MSMFPRKQENTAIMEDKFSTHQCPVYNWATLFLRDINTGDLTFQVGGVSNLRQNMVMRPAGFGPENDCAVEGQH
jgi:hypothetical protein